MTKIEFQAEAVATIARPAIPQPAPTDRATTVTIDSLLLGLQLRTWLTDAEHQFLDDMAPPPALAFLIQDGRYLHPQDVPLFDIEQLGSVVSQSADAIFTQRYEHTNGTRRGLYHIHWANLPPVREKSLVFGLFGPIDQMSSPQAINRFYRLIADMRRAYVDGSRIVGQISDCLCAGAGMVVDRDTGTVLCCNDHMAELCGSSTEQIVGRSIDEIKLENDAAGRSRIRMEHVDQSHYHLCLIQTGRTLGVEDDTDPLMSAQFIHAMRNKLTGILATARELQVDAAPRDVEMINTVSTEAQDLAEQITRFELLLNFRNRTNQAVDLMTELTAVLNACQQESMIKDLRSDRRSIVRAPAGAWETLFRAVVEQSLAGRVDGGLRIYVLHSGRQAELRFTRSTGGASRAKPFLGQFISRLASLLGATVSLVEDSDTGETTTELRCPLMD